MKVNEYKYNLNFFFSIACIIYELNIITAISTGIIERQANKKRENKRGQIIVD